MQALLCKLRYFVETHDHQLRQLGPLSLTQEIFLLLRQYTNLERLSRGFLLGAPKQSISSCRYRQILQSYFFL